MIFNIKGYSKVINYNVQIISRQSTYKSYSPVTTLDLFAANGLI